ncbi:response regulator [Rhizobium paknamense]|uniref:Two-component system OmpR family response regulator/two-component system response regulator CpxR n=1 Tax=Rhizobium paknamense TaxID=1206817 RepID=A0ABU0IE22_9HYPH|nr:response regulator [Rhizobium paknamense]MDQ0456416.1 two-component system OmpR family response regulator/two-component system response regulator CpxR [Rhizobium paknamense]
MTRVLLVDDDRELSGLLTEYLLEEGFEVQTTDDGRHALDVVAQKLVDIIVLDIMMPRLDGMEVLQALRKVCDVPVIMLTARGDEADRIAGLDLGADDYMPKPCSPGELVARLRAILRRSGLGQAKNHREVLQSGSLMLYPSARNAFLDGTPLALTGTEYSLLEVLVRQAGKVVSKQEISTIVFGKALTPFDRRIDVHLSSVRQKLGVRPDGHSWIQSVRGQGYILVQD